MKKVHPIIDETVNDLKMVIYSIIKHQHSLMEIYSAIYISQWTTEKQNISHG